MLLQQLDDSILEQVFCRLSAHSLASVQRVCFHWYSLVDGAQLWQQRMACSLGRAASVSHVKGTGSTHQSPPYTYRSLCLHRAASAKWCTGRLCLSSTLNGHSSRVTCMNSLGDLLITGSTDGSSRVWDLARGVQLHLLQMPAGEPVVAAELVSVALAVTATAKRGALLWRGGSAIRRFEVLPGGHVTSLALTDTQLLLGSSGGTVQHYDLFSGQQQLITRHGSGVTCLQPHRQQQQQAASQQQQQQEGPDDDWLIIVGCMEGQVSCISSATGRLIWQLPVRYPSKVVSLQLVDGQLGWQQPLHEQQHKDQQTSRQGLQCTRKHHLLLHALNARSQLICWRLPIDALSLHCAAAPATTTAAASTAEPGASKAGRQAHKPHASAAAAAGGRSLTAGELQQFKMPLWPLAVSTVAAPAAAGTGSSSQRQELQQEGQRQLQAAAHNSCTCLVSPLFGQDCLLIGSTLGYVTVAQLQHGQRQGNAVTTGSSAGGSSSNSGTALPHGTNTAPNRSSSEPPAPEVSSTWPLPAESSANHQAAADQQTASSTTQGAGQLPSGPAEQQQQQQPGKSAGAKQDVQLHVVQHCSLFKLGKLLAGRQAPGSTAKPKSTLFGTASVVQAPAAPGPSNRCETTEGSGTISTEVSRVPEHLLDGSKVFCMLFAPNSQLVVGLGSGHVCCLKFKHPASSVWA